MTRLPRRGPRALVRALAGLVVGGTLAASLLAVAAGPASASVGAIAAAVADDGAKVTAEKVVDARTVDLTLSTPSVGTATVRLLLPKDWATRPAWKFPAIYMFSGPDKQAYKSWTAYTDIETYTARDDVLYVLPSVGASATYTDEQSILGKNPKWETFHTVELPQILARGYRANGRNAVAGLSGGGFGALAYTFRHPGLYKATASYSGVTDLFDPAAKLASLSTRITAGESVDPWGPVLLNIPNQFAHNPMSNLTKFKNQPLYLSSGEGQPGPLDDAPGYKDQVGGRIIEAATGEMNQRFAAGLALVGAKPTVHIYPGGLHNWPYWQREFKASLPLLKAAIGGPTSAASSASAAGPAPAPADKGLLGGLLGGLFG